MFLLYINKVSFVSVNWSPLTLSKEERHLVSGCAANGNVILHFNVVVGAGSRRWGASSMKCSLHHRGWITRDAGGWSGGLRSGRAEMGLVLSLLKLSESWVVRLIPCTTATFPLNLLSLLISCSAHNDGISFQIWFVLDTFSFICVTETVNDS